MRTIITAMATNGKMSSGLDLRSGDTTDNPFKGCRTVASLGGIKYVSSLTKFRATAGNIVVVTLPSSALTLGKNQASASPATGFYGKDPRTCHSNHARHSHSEFPEYSMRGAQDSFSVRSLARYSDPDLFLAPEAEQGVMINVCL